MDAGDTEIPVSDNSTVINQNNNNTNPVQDEESCQKVNTMFSHQMDFEYEVYDPKKRKELAEKVKSGEIIRSTFQNPVRKLAALRYKCRKEFHNERGLVVLKFVYLLGVVGCITCPSDEPTFAFFSEDFDSAMRIKRVKMENPDADEAEVKRLKVKNPRKSGSSLSDHRKKACKGTKVDEPLEDGVKNVKITNFGAEIKNSQQLKDKKFHIMKLKTAQAMMVISSGIAMSFCNNDHLKTFCGLTSSLSQACLGIRPDELVYSATTVMSHVTEQLIPELDADLKNFAAKSRIMKNGLPTVLNAFSQDVTSSKKWSFLDLSIRSIQLWPVTSFQKNLISLQLLPKSETNQFKYDHTASTSADVNRYKLTEYGFMDTEDDRTDLPITTDRASSAQASAEYLSWASEVCGAHFLFTLFADAIKNSSTPFLDILMLIMQAICRITRYRMIEIGLSFSGRFFSKFEQNVTFSKSRSIFGFSSVEISVGEQLITKFCTVFSVENSVGEQLITRICTVFLG